MFCPKCGTSNADDSKFCLSCGTPFHTAGAPPQQHQQQAQYQQTQQYQQPQQQQMRGAQANTGNKIYAVGKTPVVALIMSFFICGLGQLYNGDVKKGLLMFFGAVIGFFLTAGILTLGFWVWGLIDAYQVADQKTPLWN